MPEGSDSSALAPIWKAITDNLGHSSHGEEAAHVAPQIPGYTFPSIPPGVPTTMIPVPVHLSSLPEYVGASTAHKKSVVAEEGEVLAVFLLAAFVWALPWILINKKICCKCFQKWMSRRLGCYFVFGLVFNVTIISIVIAREPDISANDVFFGLVQVLELLSDKLMDVLTQLCIVAGVLIALVFRKKIVALLGFDQQIVRADLKDVLTLFTMNRFRPIEVSIWKVEGLPVGFTSRTLFARIVLGVNEPHHSRPHDGCTTSVALRENFQLNYDPEDNTQKMSIVIKHQEVVGSAVSQLAPVAGALVGAAGGMVTPLGPAAGAGLGVVTGVGAANSLGVEVARVDLSSTMLNRIRNASVNQAGRGHLATGPAVPWTSEHFTKVDLVPQGSCWLRVLDVPEEETA